MKIRTRFKFVLGVLVISENDSHLRNILAVWGRPRGQLETEKQTNLTPKTLKPQEISSKTEHWIKSSHQ